MVRPAAAQASALPTSGEEDGGRRGPEGFSRQTHAKSDRAASPAAWPVEEDDRDDVTKAGEADLPSGFAVLDTRGVPCLSYYGRAETGGTVRTDFHLVFRQTEGGETSYLLKDLALGAVYRLTRPGDAPSLTGTWTNAEQGVEVVLQGERYTFSVEGEVQDAGRYEVSEDAIVTHSDGGGDETLRYVLDGDRLTIVDEDGVRMELTRAP